MKESLLGIVIDGKVGRRMSAAKDVVHELRSKGVYRIEFLYDIKCIFFIIHVTVSPEKGHNIMLHSLSKRCKSYINRWNYKFHIYEKHKDDLPSSRREQETNFQNR